MGVRVSILPLSTILLLDFGLIPTFLVFFCFSSNESWEGVYYTSMCTSTVNSTSLQTC